MVNDLGRFEKMILFVAFWPVWEWYFRRAVDGSDEPWQLLAAIGSVALLREVYPQKQSTTKQQRAAVLLGLSVYGITFLFLPPLGHAVIAIGTLVLSSVSVRRIPPAGFLLLALSLPLFSSLDFMLSYPLRRLTAALALPLFALAGFEVGMSGSSFLWNGSEILIDAPCSGIRMLYTALLLSAFLGCHLRLRWRPMILLLCTAVGTALGANVFRSASLFFVESRPFAPALLEHFENVLHTGIGLFLFSAAALAITSMGFALSRRQIQSSQP